MVSTRSTLCAAALSLLAAAGCATEAAPADPDREFRRAELVASLVNPSNGYSRLRLARYATDDAAGWDSLPEWNPRSERVEVGELAAGAPALTVGEAAQPIAIPAGDGADQLVALGEAAFFRYPAQPAPDAGRALASVAAANDYGLWLDPERGAGGVVRVAMADGTVAFSYSCATCHAALHGDVLIVGLGNDRLDLGRLAVDAGTVDPARAGALLAWGRGRLDVTTATGLEPVALSDLRPTRLLSHLQHDATVAQRDRESLAIRIETLLITSHSEAIRPPRQIARGLAAYVWSLADRLPPAPPLDDAQRRGSALFQDQCAGCHVAPAFTGAPVLLAAIGTDPTLGLSPDRGTGMYRVPSLRGVGDRRLLLHDGALTSLEALFDPMRAQPGYREGARPGAVPGHVATLGFSDGDRSDLIAFLRTL